MSKRFKLPPLSIALVVVAITLQFATTSTPDDRNPTKHLVDHARVALVQCRQGYESLRTQSESYAQVWLSECALQMKAHMDDHYRTEFNAPSATQKMKLALSTFYAQWNTAIATLSAQPGESPIAYSQRVYQMETRLKSLASDIVNRRPLPVGSGRAPARQAGSRVSDWS